MTNVICNEKARDAELWAEVWEKAPNRVVQYYHDFKYEMQDYLDKRPQDCFM